MKFTDWGLISYSQAYERQKALFEQAIQDKLTNCDVNNEVLLCEHFPVITVGKHGLFSNLLFSEKTLTEKNVELYQVDRGGDITYHGPGQLVGYPIFDLEYYKIGLKVYVRCLEEVIIRTIAEYGITGERLNGASGVWLDKDLPGKARKIAAIGVRSSRFVTMHGFALNVNTDLSYFKLINPCGFTDKGVTSMQNELGNALDIEKVKIRIRHYFEEVFV